MLLLVGCGRVDLNCEMYPQPFRPQGGCYTVKLDALNSAGHGGAAPLSAWEGMKGSVIQKRQWDDSDEPYMGIGKYLEFGGGVRTLPPNLKFRKLLKSAT